MKVKLIALLVVMIAAIGIYAQVHPSTVVVNVPTEFTVADLTMPAGDYTITAVSPMMLKFTGPTTAFIMTRDKIFLDGSAETKLLFMTDNGKLVLHQIMVRGQSHAHDIIHASTTMDLK
jgi:hypothetical protein